MGKDMSSAGLKVFLNDRNMATIKMMGKADPSAQSLKYEVRYSAAGAGEGNLRFSLKGGIKQEMKVQYLPNNGLDLKIQVTREAHSDASRHLHAEVTRGGEKYLEYKNDVIPTFTATSTEVKVDSQFDISEKSMFYAGFCNYGCFKTRTMHSKLFVDKAKPYKFSLEVELTKDGAKVLDMEINSRNNPYIFKINAPRILPKILPTGRSSIEFEADHNPGQYLHVTSNTNMLASFKVDKMGNGMRKVELNGKELVQADFNMGDNTVSQTTTLPDGRSLTTTVSWQSDDLKKNRVNLKLDGTERQLDSHFEWDVNNKEAMTMKMQAKGNNKRWGNYEISRDVKMSVANRVFKVDLTGDANFDNFAMPSPIATKLQANLDFGNKNYMFDFQKDFNGKKMGVTLNNGKFSLTV